MRGTARRHAAFGTYGGETGVECGVNCQSGADIRYAVDPVFAVVAAAGLQLAPACFTGLAGKRAAALVHVHQGVLYRLSVELHNAREHPAQPERDIVFHPIAAFLVLQVEGYGNQTHSRLRSVAEQGGELCGRNILKRWDINHIGVGAIGGRFIRIVVDDGAHRVFRSTAASHNGQSFCVLQLQAQADAVLATEHLDGAKVFGIAQEKREAGIEVSKVFGQDADAVVAHAGGGNFKITAGFNHRNLARAAHGDGFPDLVLKHHLVAAYDIHFQRFAVFIHHFAYHFPAGFELEGKGHLLPGFVDGEVLICMGIAPATRLQGNRCAVVPAAGYAAGMQSAVHDFEVAGIVARHLLEIAHARRFDAYVSALYGFAAAFVEQAARYARGQQFDIGIGVCNGKHNRRKGVRAFFRIGRHLNVIRAV